MAPKKLPTQQLQTERSVLLVVDIQEKLLPLVHEPEQLIHRARILVEAATALGIPIVVTEQYPQGLGPTDAKLKDILPPDVPVLTKIAFGALAEEGIPEQLAALERLQWLVCGMETHICVNQTVHQLLSAGYQVHVAEDAVSSARKQTTPSVSRKWCSLAPRPVAWKWPSSSGWAAPSIRRSNHYKP